MEVHEWQEVCIGKEEHLCKGSITPTECSAEYSANLLAQATSMGRVCDYFYTSKDETS